MSANSTRWMVLRLGGLLAACATTSPAPVAYRRTIDEAKTLALGAWTRVEGKSFTVDGELLAVDPRDLYLERDQTVTIVHPACVTKLTIAAFEGSIGGPAIGGVLGSLSTPTHGFFLIFSLPIWIATSAGTSYAQSGAGHLIFKREGNLPLDTNPARKWARFPQGMPTGYVEGAKGIRKSDADCVLAPEEKPTRPLSAKGGRP